MSVGAPRDPLFYVDLEAFGQRTGTRPEDALFIWASESGLDPSLSGNSRTFSTLMHYVAVPGLMSEDVWQRLPSMTHREQLPWIETGIYAPAHRVLGGRRFNSTFEVYLANAAPALLRTDGVYSDATPMYVGNNYPDNWTMDNYPAGVAAYGTWAADARSRGQKQSLRAAYSVAEDLISKGVLKGYVSLGDLKAFAKRMLGGGGRIANEAIALLNNVRANVAAGKSPSIDPPSGAIATHGDFFTGRTSPYTPPTSTAIATPTGVTPYTPDFDSAFKPGAPPDTRVATPAAARNARPSSTIVRVQNFATGEEGPPFLAQAAIIGGAVAVVVALTFVFGGKSRKTKSLRFST